MAVINHLQHVYFFLDKQDDCEQQEQDASLQSTPRASQCHGATQLQFNDDNPSIQLPYDSPILHKLTLPMSAILEPASRSFWPADFQGKRASTVYTSSSPAKAAHSTDSSCSSSISSRESAFNPQAPTFAPYTVPSGDETPRRDKVAPGLHLYYTLRDSNGKGKGLFASRFIPRGTLIIREKPLLTSDDQLIHVWREYNALPIGRKSIFDQLHFHRPEYLDLEAASRFHLMDSKLAHVGKSGIDHLVADQVRVMGIFAANNFSTVDEAHLALFATISRFNHSCMPNAYHFYDPHENAMTIYASQDIAEGAELFINYTQGVSTYQVRAQRIEQLRSKYGFTCQCPACSDRTENSNDRRTMLNDVMWGLQMYIDHGPAEASNRNTYHPSTPELALIQAEDVLGLFKAEGIVNVELLKALRIASIISLHLSNLDGALQYTTFEIRISNDLAGAAAYQFEIMGCGPATAWAAHIEQMLTAEQHVEEDTNRLPKKKSKNKAEKNYRFSAQYNQNKATATNEEGCADDEAEYAQIKKQIKAHKKRVQKQRAKAKKRAQADAEAQVVNNDMQDLATSSMNVRQ